MKNVVIHNLLLTLVVMSFFGRASVSNNTESLRLIALAPHLVETLFELGVGDQILATVDYADYPEQALSIPRVGGHHGVSIEKIVALKPDLVFVWQGGNKQADIDRLHELGLKVVISQADSIWQLANEINHFANLLGVPERGSRVAERYTRALNQLADSYADKYKVPVFYQMWSRPLMTTNGTTWINQQLQICGARNVFADASAPFPQVNLEHIVAKKPELIIIPDEASESPQPEVDWQRWNMIPAVKHNQFIHVNADLLHRFSTRMLEGLQSMCHKIDQIRLTQGE